jgi:hypothetical protein
MRTTNLLISLIQLSEKFNSKKPRQIKLPLEQYNELGIEGQEFLISGMVYISSPEGPDEYSMKFHGIDIAAGDSLEVVW